MGTGIIRLLFYSIFRSYKILATNSCSKVQESLMNWIIKYKYNNKNCVPGMVLTMLTFITSNSHKTL